jgi:D-sedoheptulose 7-phosphate isomerase
MINTLGTYAAALARLAETTAVTDGIHGSLPAGVAVVRVADTARTAAAAGGRLLFVGNGGSAGIASHLAVDFSKNAGVPALVFTDGAALTCFGNDYGYDQVFARPIGLHARPEDVLVAISSSGRSPNILNAVATARARGCGVFTFSGFDDDNPLRRLGDLNFHVPSHCYGIVEIAHLTLIHAALETLLGELREAAPSVASPCEALLS